jgi:hypothetical protein
VKKVAFLTQNKAKLCKKIDHNIGFREKLNFCGKLLKIAENCDHNIDPWSMLQSRIKSCSWLKK